MTEAVRQGPLAGLKVIEFTHMVMGPAAGVILADLGADVIKVEPANGDATRDLKGSGAGYFVMYNRNKRSIRLDMKSDDGLATAKALCAGADVIIENFRAGALDRLGLSYEELSKINPGLIYCSEKGFLPGPYEQRTALDEVAQMMGGLAYMTGPAGRPLRAGASVIDVTGGMFGVIGILAALEERRRTGRGQLVKSALYETTAFLVGQHMAQKAVTGNAARPMPERISAWSIYDVFQTKDGEGVFIGVVTDKLWLVFCDLFGLSELKANPDFALNNARVAARDQILPVVREVVGQYTREELIDMLSPSGLPFAPIARPEDLFDDPHLNTGGLIDVTMPNDEVVRLPSLPIEMDGRRFNEAAAAPKSGEHQEEVLAELAKA